jgi:hypothetical protein
VQHLDHRKMSRVCLQQFLLLVHSYSMSVICDWQKSRMRMGNVPGSPTVESFVGPFEALVLDLLDIAVELYDIAMVEKS